MRSQVGSIPEQYSNLDWAVTTTASGGTLSPQTVNFYIQGFNRVGRNLLSVTKSLAIAQDDSAVITIGSSVALPGEDLWYIAIAAETTGNNTDAVQVATYAYKDLVDQETLNTLPIDITFTNDGQLVTSGLNVATFTDLATLNPLTGTVRSVDDEGGKWYVFDGIAWVDYLLPNPFLYLTNTRGDGGCDRLSGNGIDEPNLLIPPLVFDINVTQVTTVPVRYWFINDAPEGAGSNLSGKVNLRLSINGATVSVDGKVWGQVFADLIKFTLVGYYRLLTRGIDTGVDNAGVEQTWNPVTNLLDLPSDLLPGYVAVYDIFLDAAISDLTIAGYDAGDVLAIEFDYLGKVGQFSPGLAALVGEDVIFGELDKFIVLPNRVLAGSALIGKFFVSNEDEETGIFDLAQPNTGGQTLVVNGATGGTFRLGAGTTIKDSEAVIAVFGTVAGFTNPGDFSPALALTGSEAIEVTVNHPVVGNGRFAIRLSYPDPLIAGNIYADWSNPSFRVYLRQNGITLWEANSTIVSASSATQIIQINDLSNYTDVTANPPLDQVESFGEYFSLIEAAQPGATSIGGGVLPAGTWEVAIRYEWSSPNYQITSLRQDIDGTTIKRLTSTFQDQLSAASLWKDSLLTVAQARVLDFDNRTDRSVYLISDLGYVPYQVDLSLSGTDDGRNIIRFSTGVGGLRPLYPMIQLATTTELLPAYSLVRIGTGLILENDVIGRSNNIRLDEDVINLTNNLRQNLVDTAGNLLVDTAGKLLVT